MTFLIINETYFTRNHTIHSITLLLTLSVITVIIQHDNTSQILNLVTGVFKHHLCVKNLLKRLPET